MYCNGVSGVGMCIGNWSGNVCRNSKWVFLESSDYIPVNAIAVRVFASNKDVNGSVTVDVAVYGDSSNAEWMSLEGYYTVKHLDWIKLNRNGSRDLRWWGCDDDNLFSVSIYGYQIER